MKSKRICNGMIILFFFSMLFLVESSFCGSQHVAQFNNGYGTFDMKRYNAQIIYDVLSNAEPEYFRSIKIYYVLDYIFCIAFFAFQAMVSSNIFNNCKTFKVRYVHIGIALARGITDAIENTLLLFVILQYPMMHDESINIASYFTMIKMLLIGLWVAITIGGKVFEIISKRSK